jgi:hypothetical protein
MQVSIFCRGVVRAAFLLGERDAVQEAVLDVVAEQA